MRWPCLTAALGHMWGMLLTVVTPPPRPSTPCWAQRISTMWERHRYFPALVLGLSENECRTPPQSNATLQLISLGVDVRFHAFVHLHGRNINWHSAVFIMTHSKGGSHIIPLILINETKLRHILCGSWQNKALKPVTLQLCNKWTDLFYIPQHYSLHAFRTWDIN